MSIGDTQDLHRNDNPLCQRGSEIAALTPSSPNLWSSLASRGMKAFPLSPEVSRGRFREQIRIPKTGQHMSLLRTQKEAKEGRESNLNLFDIYLEKILSFQPEETELPSVEMWALDQAELYCRKLKTVTTHDISG